jgi:tRNA (guanine37-N1)-methyltransferase
LTLFPDFINAFCNTSIIKKGIEKKAFNINIKNIRENAINKYGQVDDLPFGGGPGMLLRPEPILKTYNSLNLSKKDKKCIFFSPKGKNLNNDYIINLTKFKNIVLICGHYEGIDQRIIDLIVDDEISIGDYILTGGEIPSMILIDALIRHLDGVINKESLNEESFLNNLLEYRQYTRPADFLNLKVPDVLISGNHKKIEEFRLEDSIRETLLKRPDLIKNNKFEDKINKIIKKIRKEIIK